jgi:hypothetical protein
MTEEEVVAILGPGEDATSRAFTRPRRLAGLELPQLDPGSRVLLWESGRKRIAVVMIEGRVRVMKGDFR